MSCRARIVHVLVLLSHVFINAFLLTAVVVLAGVLSWLLHIAAGRVFRGAFLEWFQFAAIAVFSLIVVLRRDRDRLDVER